MKNTTFEKIGKIFFICAIVYLVEVLLIVGALAIDNKKSQYAKEHNCRWDYNDMCYTVEQRPWLFND